VLASDRADKQSDLEAVARARLAVVALAQLRNSNSGYEDATSDSRSGNGPFSPGCITSMKALTEGGGHVAV
jgi:hypothetical protein